jgi:DNA-binding winged helix-turn-helix (wHTH) protein
MAMQAANYRFGPYELRSRPQELYKDGVKMKLRPQPFQVLSALVERAGDVLIRESCANPVAKETFGFRARTERRYQRVAWSVERHGEQSRYTETAES